MEKPDVLLVREVIADLRVDKMTVYRLIQSGKIPAINLGTRNKNIYRIPRKEYEQFKQNYCNC